MVMFYNPFDGIFCFPYWQAYALLLSTWLFLSIFFLLRHAFSCCCQAGKAKVAQQSTDADLQQSLAQIIMNKYLKNLQLILASCNEFHRKNDEHIYGRIAMSIMQFIPNSHMEQITSNAIHAHANKSSAAMATASQRQDKNNWTFLIDIYFAFRSVAHLLCLVIIVLNYVQWHGKNSSLSMWDKYSAFCVALLLYHPSLKLTGFLLYGRFASHFAVLPVLSYVMDSIYLLLFCLAAFPFLFGALFVFIPTVITFVVINLSILFVFMMVPDHEHTIDSPCHLLKSVYYNHYKYLLCIHMLPMLILLMVCIVPFYGGSSWRDAYEFATHAQYCPQSDRLGHHTEQYNIDIIFLIVSWFIF